MPVVNDVARSAYWYKWHPHSLFANSEYSIWMDSSAYDIKLDNIKAELFELTSTNNFLHIEKHPSRHHSLKEEMEVNCHYNKDDVGIMRSQVMGYYKMGYKDSPKFFVPETGLMFKKHNDVRCVLLSDIIWEEMAIGKTKRDQLVFSYALWKTTFGLNDGVTQFSFEHKMNDLVKFKDHPHRSLHMEKVALIGPWLGEDHLEEAWVNHAQSVLKNAPVDKVVVGCKAGRESMYDCLSPDKVQIVDTKGKVFRHLVDGKEPVYDVNTNGKDVIRISPTTTIMKKIYKQNIVVLWCTVRPTMMVETYKFWMEKASDPEKISLIVGVDTEDQKNELITLGLNADDITVVPPNPTGKRGVAWPAYCLSSNLVCDHDDDIVIFASDDFYPMQYWDIAVRHELADFNGCLIVNDKYTKQSNSNNEINVVTIPIMTYDTLVANNKTIYHPAYTHCYSDNELFDNLTEMHRIKISTDSIYIEHKHWGLDKRERDVYDEGNVESSPADAEIYKSRKKLNLKLRQVVMFNTKKLSILTITMPNRKGFLNELTAVLHPQVNGRDDVEWLVLEDNGEMDLGEKRNKMIDMATGEYIVFVDDDDLVSVEYVNKMLTALNSHPHVDCTSLIGVRSVDGQGAEVFKHSIQYKGWYDQMEDGKIVYYRTPNHWNAVKRVIAGTVRFKDEMNCGEDHDYSNRIRPHLVDEVQIPDVMYHFRYRNVTKEYNR